MKRRNLLFLGLFALTLSIGALGMFTSCTVDPGITDGTNFVSSTGGGSSSSAPTGGSVAGFGLFSDSVALGVVWDTDCMQDVWSDFSAGMTIEKIFTGTGEGAEAWKFTGTGAWMGMGIRVNPLTLHKDMSALSAAGKMKFMFKGTKRFKVGIKDGNGIEKWVSMVDGSLGFKLDDTWCSVEIPLTSFPGIDFTKVQQYYMWVADAALGYTVGSVYHIDNLYFSTN